jgi:Uma2 family endonuclease
MLSLRRGTIDDTVTPAIEWINGRAVQKLMPTDLHALMSGLFFQILFAWAKIAAPGQGLAGVEWRFNAPPNAYDNDSVVPDVAYLATYGSLPKSERRYPTIPPDIAVEVRSPADEQKDIENKRAFYLRWGVKLIIEADPERRTVHTYEQGGKGASLTENDTLTSTSFPTLTIDLAAMFAELDAFNAD